MQIQAHIHPELDVVSAVRALEAVCQAQDGLTGTLFLDPSLNVDPGIPCLLTLSEPGELLAVLTLFAPSRDELELVGLTYPSHRRNGHFRALVRAAAEVARANSIPDLVFSSERTSESGVAAVQSFGAALDFTEYRLRYDKKALAGQRPVPQGLTLREATPDDLEDMCAISSVTFSEPPEQTRRFLQRAMEARNRTQYVAHRDGVAVGIAAIGYEEGEATVFGLAVSPALQNQGIGRGILALLLGDLAKRGVDQIAIEVDSTNANALHLYLSCGFVEEVVNDYYRLPVSQMLSEEPQK
ncbi:MAG: GNAT family N-acetyltransferase [Christensenella sp.]|nr:GNAT family N-acetyltransferase [Christensenella sp.]